MFCSNCGKEIAEDSLYGEEYNKLLDSLIYMLNFKINKGVFL